MKILQPPNIPEVTYKMSFVECRSCGDWTYRCNRLDTGEFIDDGVCGKCGGTDWYFMPDGGSYWKNSQMMSADGVPLALVWKDDEIKKSRDLIQMSKEHIEKHERHIMRLEEERELLKKELIAKGVL